MFFVFLLLQTFAFGPRSSEWRGAWQLASAHISISCRQPAEVSVHFRFLTVARNPPSPSSSFLSLAWVICKVWCCNRRMFTTHSSSLKWEWAGRQRGQGRRQQRVPHLGVALASAVWLCAACGEGKGGGLEEVSTLTHRLGLPHAAAKFFGCLRKTKTKTENRKLSTRTVDAFVSLSRVSCVISVSNLQLNWNEFEWQQRRNHWEWENQGCHPAQHNCHKALANLKKFRFSLFSIE